MATKTEEQLEERQGLALDASKTADEIHSTIRKSELLRDDRAVRKLSDELRDALGGAHSCETATDFDTNVQVATTTLAALKTALKTAKKEARKEKDTVALECIDEALDDLKTLAREIAELTEDEDEEEEG